MNYYHCPGEEKKKKPAAYREVRTPEINHRKWKEEQNLHLYVRMENLANTSSEVQKPELWDPEKTEKRVRSFILGVLIVGLVGSVVCLHGVFKFLFLFLILFFN